MKKFGVLKSKILKKLTESYSKGNKDEMKEILKSLKENKDFKDLYLFYEEMENKFIDDSEVAKLYVEELTRMLKEKSKSLDEFVSLIEKKIGNIEVNENEIYNTLDQLMEEDHLNNIDKKLIAKKKLTEHLTNKKELKKITNTTYTPNEKMLNAVLTNNFNVLYDQNLSETEKQELKYILSLTDSDINDKTSQLKENILTKVDRMLTESTDVEFNNKLNKVKEEVVKTKPSKYGFYKLKELESSL
jgi:hypothetical protein